MLASVLSVGNSELRLAALQGRNKERLLLYDNLLDESSPFG